MIRHDLSISRTILGDTAGQRVGETSVVPPGLASLGCLFPALKRWAKLGRPSGAGFLIACAILLCGLSTSVRAADSGAGDIVLRALREEMDRSKAKLKMDGVPAPYYIEYRVTEIDQYDASAVFGALRNQQHNHGRLLRVVVRVGDYKQDSFYGTGEGAVDLVPSDDDVFAIRHRIWLATDRAYKAASEALSAKQAALKQLKVDEPVDDFAKASPVESIEPLAHFSATELTSDFTSWLHLLEEASGQYRTDKDANWRTSTPRCVSRSRTDTS